MALPVQINYNDPSMANLPVGTTSKHMTVAPANGHTYTNDNQTIIFDVPSVGNIVPSSLMLSYKVKVTGQPDGSTTGQPVMKGIPFATPFQRCEVLFGSSVVESINDWNVLYAALMRTKLSFDGKRSLQYSLGIETKNANNGATLSNTGDHHLGMGRQFAVLGGGTAAGTVFFEEYTVAGPLNCCIANAEKLFPVSKMSNVRIQLTMDTLANMFATGNATVTPAAIELTNLELHYECITFDPQTDALIASMANPNGEIMIKTQSYSSSTQTIPSGSQSQLEYLFNNRLSSIKSLLLLLGGNQDTAGTNHQVNGMYDSVDVTNGMGDYQFVVAGTHIPPQPLSASRSKALIFEQLSDCFGGTAHDLFGSAMSITPKEFAKLGTEATDPATGDGAFFAVGISTEKLNSSALMTGISSQLSPINVRINFGSANTDRNHNLMLVTLHDAIISVNLMTKQATVRV